MASRTNTARLHKDISDGSKSHQVDIKSSLSYLTKFLTDKNMANYDQLDGSVLCNEEFIGEFATFLTVTKQLHRNKDDPLKAGSATTIFSNVKNYLKKKFPHVTRLCNDGVTRESFWDATEHYFTDVVNRIDRIIGHAFIEEGLPIEDKAPAVGRNDMKEITKSCCK